MKVLLVQLPTSHMGAGEKVYPLGLSRLSSTIPSSFDKRAIDMNIHPDPWPELHKMLTMFGPDVVALSFRNLDPLAGQQSSYLSSLKSAALLVRSLLPDARIVAGGPAFSLFAERLMQEVPQIDAGMRGEGELIFFALLEKKWNPAEIPGILWRRNSSAGDKHVVDQESLTIRSVDSTDTGCSCSGNIEAGGSGYSKKGVDQIVINRQGPHLDMDTIPPLDVDLFSPTDYTEGNKYVAAIGIEGKRGCDLQCGYCLYPKLGGPCMRLRSPSLIVDEMEMLHKEFNISLFHMTDSVVNRPTGHFDAFCAELRKRRLDIMWTGFFREESFTDESMDAAKRAGMAAIYFSADALSDYGLKLLGKRMTIDDVLDASRMSVRQDVLTMCHFLINLPGENENHISESRENLEKILDIHGPAGNLGAVIFNNIRLYPDAPITKRLIRSEELSDKVDLLYPVYYNPVHRSHILHEFETMCHTAGVFSRLKINISEELQK